MSLSTVEYRPGQRADVYVGRLGGPPVLLWHGRGPDERSVLAPLASALAGAGCVVVVPDWRSDAADGGKAQLLASVEWLAGHAEDYAADLSRWALMGWSLGGRCALGALCAQPPSLPSPTLTVAIAASTDAPDPVFGVSVTDSARGGVPAGYAVLVHGTQDTIVPIEHARRLQLLLHEAGTPAELHELPTDHAGVIGTVYDPASRRCRPSSAQQPRYAIGLIAAVLQTHFETAGH
jgi:acetyl esterase/lipase